MTVRPVVIGAVSVSGRESQLSTLNVFKSIEYVCYSY